jgi:hypothetical protein
MKSREERMRKLRSAKLSAPHRKLQRMRSRIDGQIMTMLGKGAVLASWSLQQGVSESGRSYPASLTVIAITGDQERPDGADHPVSSRDAARRQ